MPQTRKPGASLSSVRARLGGFKFKIGLMGVGIEDRMNSCWSNRLVTGPLTVFHGKCLILHPPSEG